MSESQAQTAAQKMIGDFAPKLVSLTDDVLFGDIWERKELAPQHGTRREHALRVPEL